MRSHAVLKLILATGTALGALSAAAALAAPTQYLTPNVIAVAGATSTTMGGVTFTNQGMVGTSRIPAGTKDFNGDTFGAFSSLDVKPGSWHRNADGSYGGVLYSLPDRGPNGIGSVGFSDYAGRSSIFNMAFTPYTGSAAISANANSLALTANGGIFFKDFNGNVTTGLDPNLPGANSFVTENGLNLPGSKTGAAAGKLSLDAESLRFLQNGNFYVGDEYGAEVYYFNASGQMLGVIQPPAALIPRLGTTDPNASPNTLSYTSQADATVGRRFNQGIEGMAIMPDQKHLATLLQSAAMQDSTSSQATRTNTRLMIYDIAGNKTPGAPVGDYVLQLPIYNTTGSGAAANATAAQSELLALNDTQFLVLSRDANGLGLANNPEVYESVLLVDITGATNIAGTAFETSYTPIAPGGSLLASITPVQQTQLVNILNTTQLSKFGININNAAGQATSTTLTEKWEGMALVPTLEEGAPQDYFLLVGNDNDFLAQNCSVGGQNCSQGVNSDALILTYRLTLPTYVDPGFLNSMTTTGPVSLGMTEMAAHDLALSGDVGQHLRDVRHGGITPAQLAGLPLSVWVGGGYVSRDESASTSDLSMGGGTVGVDAQVSGSVTLGVAAGYYSGNSSATGGYHVDPSAFQLSAYGFWNQGNMHANLSGTWSSQQFDGIARPGAYGLTASGKTDGTGYAVSGEFGFDINLGDGLRAGPVAGFHWLDLDVDGYTEAGAAGGNIIMPHLHDSGIYGYAGAEAAMDFDAFAAVLRLTYNTEDVYKTGPATFTLANAGNVMGTQTVLLPGLGQAHVEPSLTLNGGGMFNWSLSYGARLGVHDGTEHHIMAGARLSL